MSENSDSGSGGGSGRSPTRKDAAPEPESSSDTATGSEPQQRAQAEERPPGTPADEAPHPGKDFAPGGKRSRRRFRISRKAQETEDEVAATVAAAIGGTPEPLPAAPAAGEATQSEQPAGDRPTASTEPPDAPARPGDEGASQDSDTAVPETLGPGALSPTSRERRPAAPEPPVPSGRGRRRIWILAALVAVVVVAAVVLWQQPKPPPVAPEPPQAGLTAEELRETEELLLRLDFDPGSVDGTIDERSREAIRLYQEAAGLPIDGEPTAALLVDLREVSRLMGQGG